jgi:hypothetical protein
VHPALRVAASFQPVQKVEFFYALKNPCSFNRSWRDAAAVRQGDGWMASLPLLNVEDYVFAYANITYDDTIVLSTRNKLVGDAARSGLLDGYYWVERFRRNREGRNGGGDPYFTDGRLAVGVIEIRR